MILNKTQNLWVKPCNLKYQSEEFVEDLYMNTP